MLGRYFCGVTLSVAVYLIPITAKANGVGVEYLVPEGFSEVELDKNLSFLVRFDDEPLPFTVIWSAQSKALVLKKTSVLDNNKYYSEKQSLETILPKLKYDDCAEWCTSIINGYRVDLDNKNKTLIIKNADNDYYNPKTNFGLVHNNYFDIRRSSNGYSSTSFAGKGYIGMPEKIFSSINWYYNEDKLNGKAHRDKSLGSWYIQKNFNDTYLRSGRQDSRDYATSVSSIISPVFSDFLTVGSQENLRQNKKNNDEIVIFTSQDVDFEIYRDNKLIRKIPGVLGKNEIKYDQLPGGFYSVEIRQINKSGRIVEKEIIQVTNVDYDASSGWYSTVGHLDETKERALNIGLNYKNSLFNGSSSVLKGQDATWLIDNNVSRPSSLVGVDIYPTFGLISGELRSTAYASLSILSQDLGSMNYSKYSGGIVSDLYTTVGSETYSYSRSVGSMRIGYNYSSYGKRKRHQVQTTWNNNFLGGTAFFTLGIEDNKYAKSHDGVNFFFNTTIVLEKISGSANMSIVKGEINSGLSLESKYESEDSIVYTGLDVNKSRHNESLNMNIRRNGTRGDLSSSVGVDNEIKSGRINYSGMFAVNSKGVTIGRESPDGVAMIVDVPELNGIVKGFDIENNIVGVGGTYAVPVKKYQDIGYAKAQSKNYNVDMNISIPANIVRAHPGQVFYTKATVDMSLSYNGFFVDESNNPVYGKIIETNDYAMKNGLFSFNSTIPLSHVTVKNSKGMSSCNMKPFKPNFYRCKNNSL